MTTYKVTYTQVSEFEVEADSEDEARDRAEAELALGENGVQVDSELTIQEVDEDGVVIDA